MSPSTLASTSVSTSVSTLAPMPNSSYIPIKEAHLNQLCNTINDMRGDVYHLEYQVSRLEREKRRLTDEVHYHQRLSTALNDSVSQLERRLEFLEAENTSLHQYERERSDVMRRMMVEMEDLALGRNDDGRGDTTTAAHTTRAAGTMAVNEAHELDLTSGIVCKEVDFRTTPWHSDIEVKEQDGEYYWRPANSREVRRVLADPDPYMCSICRELFAEGEPTIVLPCKHRYHHQCGMPYWKNRFSCPLCTQKFAIKAELTPIKLGGEGAAGERGEEHGPEEGRERVE